MARPLKQGLDYFPHDTDASRDEKLEAMICLYGCAGHGFYFMLLERIYHNGTELDTTTPNFYKIICRQLHMSEKSFRKMLESAINIGLFSREIWEDSGKLSSNSIISRKNRVTAERERMRRIREKQIQNNELSTEQTANILPDKPATNEGKERKVKGNINIKGKEIKGKGMPSSFHTRHSNYPKNRLGGFSGIACTNEEDVARVLEERNALSKNRKAPSTDFNHESSGTGTASP